MVSIFFIFFFLYCDSFVTGGIESINIFPHTFDSIFFIFFFFYCNSFVTGGRESSNIFPPYFEGVIEMFYWKIYRYKLVWIWSYHSFFQYKQMGIIHYWYIFFFSWYDILLSITLSIISLYELCTAVIIFNLEFIIFSTYKTELICVWFADIVIKECYLRPCITTLLLFC